MRSLLFAAFVLFVACGPGTPTLGGLKLETTETSFKVLADKQVLVDSYAGEGAYAAVAVRNAKARYEMSYGAWRITDGSGEWKQGKRFEWKQVTPTLATGFWRDATGAILVNVEASSPGAGEVALRFTAADPEMNRMSLAFRCDGADHFLGFGAQADGIDHRGQTVPIWTSEPGIGKQLENDEYPDVWFLVGTRHASSYGLPTWVSNRGYLGVVESDRRTVFELCSKQEDAFRIEVWGNSATLWLFEGSPARSLVRATGRVLGRPMRPPPLAFAPWNDAIFGSQKVRDFAKLLRDNDIPSSAIWTEDFRGGTEQGDAYRLVEDWDIDRTLYPGAEALAAELKDSGFSWQAYFNTFLVTQNPVFDAALAGNHFVKNDQGEPYLFSGVTFKDTGLADLSNPATREFVKSYMRQALDIGFTGWMADFGEWLPHDAVLASGEDPLEAHNRYAGEWARLNKEVLDERASDGVQRLFFSRAGWLRSNAVTPVVWAGDQRTSFQRDDGLPTVIPMGINLGLAGVSTYGSDVSGYQSGTNPPPTRELFFRWTSLGALSPVMRTHHGTNARQGVKLDADAETMAHYRRWARFHIQLFPYFDAHSAEAETTGVPIIRGLPLMFPADEQVWGISDEYLLGGAMLVAPVVDEGATSREVYVPAGDWVSWDGAQRVTGPVKVMVAAPVSEVPLFVRAGAVIPRLPETVDTLIPAQPPTVDLDDVKNERSLLFFPGAESQFMERDGTRYTAVVADSVDYREADVVLADCTSASDRGCVDKSGPRPVVRLKKQGPLDVPGGYLVIEGPAKKYDVEVVLPR